ncbi:HD family phosphohydrolase, partial [Pontiella sp.]|uniref:HD family phosphohydrolase n=1 Tax=Pontiella sp. TaxID=2837462 RepID=UPI003562E44E
MKKLFKEKKKKGIAERKTEVKRKHEIPYQAVGLGLLLWLSVSWLFFGHGIVRTPTLDHGQTVPAPIISVVDFECVNLTETALSRKKAADAVPLVFNLDLIQADRSVNMINMIFEQVSRYSAASTNRQHEIIQELDELLLGSKVTAAELIAAFPGNQLPEAKAVLNKGILDVMKTGVISDESRISLFHNKTDGLLTIAPASEGIPSRTVSQNDVYSTRKAVWAITDSFKNETQRKLLDRILPFYIGDNLHYNDAATAEARRAVEERVPEVIQQYPAGRMLARAGDTVTEQTLLLIREHEKQRAAMQDVWEQTLEILGNSLMLLLGLVATAVFLKIVNPTLIRQTDKLLLMVILSLITLGMARITTYLSVQYELISPSFLMYLVPYGLAVLLAGILLGGSAAFAVGFLCSFCTAVFYTNSFDHFAIGMLVTITAASSVRNIHKRSSLFRAGIWICAAKVLFVLISAILSRPSMPTLLGQMLAAILTGMLATIFALLLIPVFEKLFKITTDITLLELSDMGHPLLQKMAIQAPGTYHHSLMVATLAQNAAEAIGANSLLIRVCAYYHDIGKMAKPEFFTENIQHRENPHDELSPHMSALVISSHVKEGLTLAKRHKLPQPIMDAIEQHHGNGLISFFYHKAKQAAKEGAGGSMTDIINDSDFRYGGAPAVSPEMAILSLADASEAAARSIEKPTPQKISNLMDEIFAMKIRDGQMDYANLTMAQINTVKQSFIFSLSNMLHGRIPYPKDD